MPVFNEISTLDAILNRTLAQSCVGEILAADDASTDGSAERLAVLADHEPRIRLLRHSKNLGKGAAVRTALQHARGEFVLIQDADLEYSPEDYPKLLLPLQAGETEAVYGTRFHPASESIIPHKLHRFGNRFLTWCTNCVTGLSLTDMATCYKVMATERLRSLRLRELGFGIDPEITVKLAKSGCGILEVPVTYRGRTRAEGKKIRWRDGYHYLVCLARYARPQPLNQISPKFPHARPSAETRGKGLLPIVPSPEASDDSSQR